MLAARFHAGQPLATGAPFAEGLAPGLPLRQNPAMSRDAAPLTYTDIELRSYLPSGWGIVSGAAGLWDRSKGAWRIDVYDSADNVWPLAIHGRDAESSGRIPALKSSVDKLYRKALS